jgi:putative zinc finger/helix-turn-helix YgiT family protein
MNTVAAPSASQLRCTACGSLALTTSNEDDHFGYGEGPERVTLCVSVPVHSCTECGFAFTTEVASEMRHEAVCRHLGVLDPIAVRGVRVQYGLSQAQFAETTGIGKASLARWESGQLIQNRANDTLLYLLGFEDNWARVQHRRFAKQIRDFKPKFRAIKAEEILVLERDAQNFELYAACET